MKRFSWNRWTFVSVATVIAAVNPGCSQVQDDESEDVSELEQALNGYTFSNGPSGVVDIGSDVSIDFVAPGGHSGFDWVGLHRVGAPFYEIVSYQYVVGDQGTLSFETDDLVDGESYELNYYLDNGYEIAETSASFQVQTPAPVYGLSSAPEFVSPGKVASIAWSAPAAHSTYDWVGLFVAGAPPEEFVDFYYLDVAGSTSGVATIVVPADAAPGSQYELRMYLDDFFVLAASSPPFMIGNGLVGPSDPVPPGDSISASWSAAPSHSASDWIGLFEIGASSSSPMAWTYVDGPGAASGSVELPMPPSADVHAACELRYFANNSYELIGRSDPFIVANELVVTAEAVLPGAMVNATWTSPGSHSALDWVGIYEVGAAHPAMLDWTFVAAAGASSGSTSLALPEGATLGQSYELRYFLNQTYELGARSSSFIAGTAPVYSISDPSGPVAGGSALELAWVAPDAHSDSDWVALHAIGASAQNFVSFSYVGGSGAGTGAVVVDVPLDTVAGSYELRYFINNSYAVKAVSSAFQID